MEGEDLDFIKTITKLSSKILESQKNIEECENLDTYLKLLNDFETQVDSFKKYNNQILGKFNEYNRSIKDKFLNEIQNKIKEVILEINKKIKEYHNMKLIRPDCSPNENDIYKLCSDFTITCEKGGWGYGQRNPHIVSLPLLFKPIQSFQFPLTDEDGYGYAIMELSHCNEIYKLFKLYLKLSK